MQFNAGSTNVLYGFQGPRSLFQVPDGGMPAGHWIMKSNSLTLAEFDLQVSSPLDDSGNYTIPVPVLRVNQASNGQITGLDVSWYLYDPESSQYTELSDVQISAVNSLVGESFIEVQDEDGPIPSDPQTITLLEPLYSNNLLATVPVSGSVSGSSTPWYFPASAGDIDGNLVPTFIKVGLSMGGLEYQFVWGT